jgi:hypothetical protein
MIYCAMSSAVTAAVNVKNIVGYQSDGVLLRDGHNHPIPR